MRRIGLRGFEKSQGKSKKVKEAGNRKREVYAI